MIHALPRLESAFLLATEASHLRRTAALANADKRVGEAIAEELLPTLTGMRPWLRVGGVKLPGPAAANYSPLCSGWAPLLSGAVAYLAEAEQAGPWAGVAVVSCPVRPGTVILEMGDRLTAEALAPYGVVTVRRDGFAPTGGPLIVASMHIIADGRDREAIFAVGRTEGMDGARPPA